MAFQESVDQLTQLMTQMQQTMLTMQTNITQSKPNKINLFQMPFFQMIHNLIH